MISRTIRPFVIVTPAKFYSVSTDYLLGLTENKNPTNAELQALHLRDDAVDAARNEKYNMRLLSDDLIGILSDIRETHLTVPI